jgi:hypothetical protein
MTFVEQTTLNSYFGESPFTCKSAQLTLSYATTGRQLEIHHLSFPPGFYTLLSLTVRRVFLSASLEIANSQITT